MSEKINEDKLFLIGIGGTGMRCLEAFTHLCAIGMMSNKEVDILSIDTDINNGNKEKTEGVIERYISIKKNEKGECAATNDTFFSAKLSLFKFVPKFEQKKATFKLISNYHAGDVEERKNNEDLANLFFDQNVQDFNLEHGYRAQTHLGSYLMYHTILQAVKNFNTEKTKARKEDEQLTTFLTRIYRAGDNARVFIFGSIFGGTGASSIPVLPKALIDAMALTGGGSLKLSDNAKFGCALLSNYFKFSTPDKNEITKEKVIADSNIFDINSQAALMFYNSDETVKTTYKRMYHIGWPSLMSLDLSGGHSKNEITTGGTDQKNPAHIVELLTATAAFDFFNKPKEELFGHEIVYKSVKYEDNGFKFSFQDFFENHYKQFKEKLIAFLGFVFLIHEEQGDIKTLSDKLASKYNLLNYKNFPEIKSKEINEYMKLFGFDFNIQNKSVNLGWFWQIQSSVANTDFLFNPALYMTEYAELKKFNWGKIADNKENHFPNSRLGKADPYQEFRNNFKTVEVEPKLDQKGQTVAEQFLAHIYNTFRNLLKIEH